MAPHNLPTFKKERPHRPFAPSIEEVRYILKKLTNNKAPDMDGICTEVLKARSMIKATKLSSYALFGLTKQRDSATRTIEVYLCLHVTKSRQN